MTFVVFSCLLTKNGNYQHDHNNAIVWGWHQASRSFPLWCCVLFSDKRTRKHKHGSQTGSPPSFFGFWTGTCICFFFSFCTNQNIWMQAGEMKEKQHYGWMFPDYAIPALRSELCLCCRGTWNNFSLLQVRNSKQFRTSSSLRRLILPWAAHPGRSSFPILINKAVPPPAGITASKLGK